MALPENLLRHLLAGHATVDLVCQLSAEAAAAAERERKLSAEAATAAERAAERERAVLRGTIAALERALELAVGGGGGSSGGGGGGGAVGSALMTRAEAEALALKAVNEYRMVHSFDPFARMHPVRSASL
jgi:hypothetical protein